MIKIIILGGTGNMGFGCASLLLNYPDVHITLGVRSPERAKKMSEMLVDKSRISFVKINIDNRTEMISLLSDFDMVFNSIGPYTLYGKYILEIALEAKVDYLDVCDDYDVTQELLEMDIISKTANISALIGMGTTPGILNIMARYGASFLDQIDNIKLCWAVGNPPISEFEIETEKDKEGEASRSQNVMPKAAWDHLIHVGSGEVPVWKEGRYVKKLALDESIFTDFPEPLGRVETFLVGHSEPITLPRSLQIKDYCACYGALPPALMRKLRKECSGNEEPRLKSVYPKMPLLDVPNIWKGRDVWGGQAAILEGKSNGKRMRYIIRMMLTSSAADYAIFNYSGQAIGCYLLSAKFINKKGILTPEECIDPKQFFEEMARHYSILSGSECSYNDLIIINSTEL